MRNPLKPLLFASCLAFAPIGALADIAELSQAQMRQLVAQEQVLSAATIAAEVVSDFGGEVVDIRGFLSDGRMTYRVLLQRDDGWVIELLYNGPDGRRVSHRSAMGKAVSSEASTTSGSANLPESANANAQENANANAGNNGNASDRGNRGSRGGRDSAGRGNSGNSGNSGNNGRGNGRGN